MQQLNCPLLNRMCLLVTKHQVSPSLKTLFPHFTAFLKGSDPSLIPVYATLIRAKHAPMTHLPSPGEKHIPLESRKSSAQLDSAGVLQVHWAGSFADRPLAGHLSCISCWCHVSLFSLLSQGNWTWLRSVFKNSSSIQILVKKLVWKQNVMYIRKRSQAQWYMHACNPNYSGSWSRRTSSLRPAWEI